MKIEGVDLASAAEALLACLPSAGAAKDQLLQAATAAAGVKPAICEFAFDLLVRSRILVESEQVLSELEAFFYLRDGSLEGLTRLQQARVLTYCFAADRDDLAHAFEIAGMTAELRPLEPGAALPLNEPGDFDLIASIGPPFHHPFSRALNRQAVEGNAPVLFAEYGGWTARVGPTVLGRNLACLDCVSARHAANGGGAKLDGIDDLQGAIVAAPTRTICNSNLRQLLLHHTVLEIGRVLMRASPVSFGGYLELNTAGETVRRETIRVPRCVGCSPSLPERYPYDVTPLS